MNTAVLSAQNSFDPPVERHCPEQILASLPAKVRQRFFKNGIFSLGEDYISGSFEPACLDAFLYGLFSAPSHHFPKLNFKIATVLLMDYLFNPQRGAGAFTVGKRHYDLGNDLFEAMLDSSMSYTCGVWRGATSLAEAQQAKLELLCQKLHLQPGMTVLGIGCGWGNFAFYAAKNYGVSVIGLTVSVEQAGKARQLCRGLPVEIRLEDYRNFRGLVDRAVSIEMIEAVGRRNLPNYFRTIERALRPGGIFALQAISANCFSKESHPLLNQFIIWLREHIFPNGYVPNFAELMPLKGSALTVENIENFWADYDLTLQAWLNQFQMAWPTLLTKYGEEFGRMWRFYLCGSMAVFRAKLARVYQITYSRH